MKKTVLLSLGTFLLVASGCGQSTDDGVVELELFSNKTENISTYQQLIEEFESEHEGIRIRLNSPPDAETLLRTRLVKDDMPDIVAIAGSALYGELTQANMLVNYEGSPMLDGIQTAYLDMLAELEGEEQSGIHGVPFAANANTVIYNKEKLAALGLDVPETWDDFIAALETAQAAEEIPIYYTLQDAWTGMPMWNSIAGVLQPDQFAERKTNKEISFADTHTGVTDKIQTLLEFGHQRMYGIGYDDGNREFAQGNGVFYFQGNWAVPQLLTTNPELDLGVFALPVTNDPEENELVSGIDVLFATLEDTEYPEEAETFISFMLEEAQSETYMEQQAAFSVLDGLLTEDPYMEGIRQDFADGNITSFPDHFYPPGIGADNLIQEFMYRGNADAFLERLDREWDQIQLRF
ncbi:raffinose/stachyose/melibiose transport system substrate-binding protein [Alkalihalobacillus xiaoxiensis]|uniref:Raffinose/stachyose/melibiose transport system substrate-binding protein n=1 Tax=Shouchella xiaoxiensis TaxID=766895 RepID=A0ABS2T082_9BACI|nr:ABC transporter substrate-binding protein [Shouchella xiaoxiensis]MBM7840671.1 raffinose/stachyose/melibiose transport system substrate-binding protein [Shouchella xiaoxiensis]